MTDRRLSKLGRKSMGGLAMDGPWPVLLTRSAFAAEVITYTSDMQQPHPILCNVVWILYH